MKQRNHNINNIEITEQDLEIYESNQKKKRKKNPFIKLLILFLVLGLIGQIVYFVYSNRSLFFKAKIAPQPAVVTPKTEIKLTTYEQQTEAVVKAFPTFVGSKEEATAVAHDFTAKYFTMSNLKSQLDFFGTEYIYPNESVKTNFKEYTLTNYYYYFPDLQNKFGQVGLPEIVGTKITDIQAISYVHEGVTKVPGYQYSVLNDMQKDSNFLKKKFKGYSIEMTLSYPSAQKSLSWFESAPDSISLSVLFDADSGKWFVAEFQTTNSSKTTSETTFVNPNQIKS